MIVSPTTLQGAFVITSTVNRDERGTFREAYVATRYREAGFHEAFVQDNVSVSERNVLRGLHADPAMSKLVQVLRGEAFDAIVDARPDSATFGKWQGFHLSESNGVQLYIPAGFLHGFLALSDGVVLAYKQNAEYDPKREVAVIWNDPALGIEWPLNGAPKLSDKDARNPTFREAFPYPVRSH